MSASRLLSTIGKLRPDGRDGFEGLVARLLEHLLERRVDLAAAGYQGGADMGVRSDDDIILIECKKYESGSRLDVQNILGAVVQATHTSPCLDLWILATTVAVHRRLRESLETESRERGVSIAILDVDDRQEPPAGPLLTLCAEFPEVTCRFLAAHLPDCNAAGLRCYLAECREGDRHTQEAAQLREQIGSLLIPVRLDKLREDLLARFASPQPSNFKTQDIRPQNAVARPGVTSALSKWLSSKSCEKVAAVLGEEGMGKTWAVARWAYDMAHTGQATTVFIVSRDVDTGLDPETCLARLVRDALGNTPYREDCYWHRLVQRWLRAERPRIVVVLDGINETSGARDAGFFIREWLEGGLQKIAPLVVTCRTEHWRQAVSHALPGLVHHVNVGPFTDGELVEALARQSLQLSDIPRSLHDTIRRPRYLDLAAKHRRELDEFSNVTPALLVFKDFEHKWAQNLAFADEVGLPEADDFQHTLKQLVQVATPANRDSGLSVSTENVNQILRDLVGDNWRNTRQAMCSMPIMRRREGGKYVFEDRYAAHYLGLLVLEQLSTLEEKDDNAFAEHFGSLTEPYGGFDFKTDLLAASVFYSLMSREDHPHTQRRLLRQWVLCQGFWGWEEVAALLPKILSPFLHAVEDMSRRGDWGHGLEQGIKYVLAVASDMSGDEARDPLVRMLNRWLHMALKEAPPDAGHEPMKVENRTGRIGSIEYALLDAWGYLPLPSFALATLAHRPFLECIDGLVAQSAVQTSAHASGSDHALRWAVSYAYGGRLVPVIREELRRARQNQQETDVVVVRALLYLATNLGEAALGPDVAALPESWPSRAGDSESINSARILAAICCWSPEAAEVCRQIALSQPVTEARWFPADGNCWARLGCMENRDQEVVDLVVGEICSNRAYVFGFDLQPIAESRYKERLIDWLAGPGFPPKSASGRRLMLSIGSTLRPADYVLPALSSFLRDATPDEALNHLRMVTQPVWANGRLGELTPGTQAKVKGIARRLAELNIHCCAGMTEDDMFWELGSPLLFRCSPRLASDVVQSYAAKLDSMGKPEFLVTYLSKGPCVVLTTETAAQVERAFLRFASEAQHEGGKDSEIWGVRALKALVMASATVAEAREALLRANWRMLLWSSLDTAWDVIADEGLLHQVCEACRVAASDDERIELLWVLRHCAHCDAPLAANVTRPFLMSSHPGVRRAACEVLSICGEPSDAVWVWDHLDGLGLMETGHGHEELNLLLRYALHLDRRPLEDWVRHVPLWWPGIILDRWDDSEYAADYACYIEAQMRGRADLSEDELTEGVEWDAITEALTGSSQSGIGGVASEFRSEAGIRFLLKHRPRWVLRWAELFGTSDICMTFEGFFVHLVAALLPEHPEVAIGLLRHREALGSGRWIQSERPSNTQVALCRHSTHQSVRQYVARCIGSVCSDLELFAWARAFRNARSDWSLPAEWLGSEDPRRRAHAVRLLGWAGSDRDDTLVQIARTDSNEHVRRAAAWADEDWWREHWAKHWYEQIYRAETIEEAWVSQELFKLVADRRAYMFYAHIDRAIPDHLKQWKRVFLAHAPFDDRSNFGRKYEDSLKKTLFGQSRQWLHDRVEPLP